MSNSDLKSKNLVSFDKLKLINFYGDEFYKDSTKSLTSLSVRNECNKEIAAIRSEIRIYKKHNNSLIKKILKNNKTSKHQFLKSVKFVSTFKVSSEKEKIKLFKDAEDLDLFFKHKISILRKDIKRNYKSFKHEVSGIYSSGDTVDYKEGALKSSTNYARNHENTIADDVMLMYQYINGVKTLDQIKNNSYIKSILAERNEILLQGQKALDSFSESIVNINAKKTEDKTNLISKHKIERVEVKESGFSYVDKLKSKINEIQAIKKEKLLELKQQKLNNISNNKVVTEGSTFKSFWVRIGLNIKYVAQLSYYNTILLADNLSRFYIPNVRINKAKASATHFEKLADLEWKYAFNKKYYSEVSSKYKLLHETLLKSEDSNISDWNKSNTALKDLKINKKNFKSELIKLKEKKASLHSAFKEEKKKQWLRFRAKEINYLAYSNIAKELKVNFKDSYKQFKLSSKFVSLKEDKKESRVNLRLSYRHSVRECDNAVEYLTKSSPVEVFMGTRFIMLISNMLFGGLAYLFTRQYKKAFVMMVITSFVYFFLLPFTFGAYSVGGDGIAGLAEMGEGITGADSRYYIVEGVYGYVSLIISAAYIIVMGLSGYRLGVVTERGVRPNTWFVSKKVMDRLYLPYTLSIPAIVVVILNTIAPLTALFILAFTDWGSTARPTLGDTFKWVGFDNFERLFSSDGVGSHLSSEFWSIMQWTFIWGFVTWIGSLVLNMVISIVLNSERIKYKKLWRTILILPMAIPGFILILMFKILVATPSNNPDDFGPLFKLLIDMGLWSETIIASNGLEGVNHILKDAAATKIFLIMMALWFGIGGGVLFFSGLLQGISKDLYEAADVDGASPIKKHTTITVPHLLFIIGPTLLPAFIGALNNFTLIWIFNDGGPYPDGVNITGAGQTDIILSWIYKLVKDPSGLENAIGITSVICILFGLTSVLVSLPGVLRSKMFREGNW